MIWYAHYNWFWHWNDGVLVWSCWDTLRPFIGLQRQFSSIHLIIYTHGVSVFTLLNVIPKSQLVMLHQIIISTNTKLILCQDKNLQFGGDWHIIGTSCNIATTRIFSTRGWALLSCKSQKVVNLVSGFKSIWKHRVLLE